MNLMLLGITTQVFFDIIYVSCAVSIIKLTLINCQLVILHVKCVPRVILYHVLHNM